MQMTLHCLQQTLALLAVALHEQQFIGEGFILVPLLGLVVFLDAVRSITSSVTAGHQSPL